MTTYQQIMHETGADKALVIKAKRAIIGSRHTATTIEIHNIIKFIKKEQEKDTYDTK